MSSKVFYYSLLCFAYSIFIGCGEPLMEHDVNTVTPIVESYLQEGTNSLTVKVYSMEEYSKDEIILSKPISQLNVSINQTLLTEISSGVYQLNLETDTIREGQKFDMQFDYNGKSIEATTTVLSSIHSIIADPQYLEISSYSYYPSFSDSTQVVVSWDDPDNSYYQVFIESPNIQDLPSLGIFGRRMMQPFKGNTYRASAREFRSAGIHIIHVYRVDTDYAELYERVSASDLANPVSYIKNAFGIFTSMSTARVNVRVYEVD